MELADISARIKPCDMNQPYIFVSYSNEDRARVWEDVLVLQELGYNVWLDEKNLDKTKTSWKKGALSAISDMYCKLLIFYVSRHSLSSQNCYDELAQTIAEETTDIHLDPLPFIAIDVEEVGDIGRFTRQVHLDYMGDPGLSKDEKTLRAKTLSNFRKNFFDSNNERIRIHPKDEPNRSSDYYENIVDSLSYLQIPPIYPPVRELPGKKRREEEARKAAERKRQEEEARQEAERRRQEEEAERRRQEEEARQEAERKRQEEEARREAERKRQEEEEAKKPLADRISQVIHHRTSLLGEAAAPVVPEEGTPPETPKPPEGKKPSLEEQLRQRLEAERKK